MQISAKNLLPYIFFIFLNLRKLFILNLLYDIFYVIFAFCYTIAGSIPGRIKPKTKKLVFTAFLFDGQH